MWLKIAASAVPRVSWTDAHRARAKLSPALPWRGPSTSPLTGQQRLPAPPRVNLDDAQEEERVSNASPVKSIHRGITGNMWGKGWTRWPTEVPSNPYYSVILWKPLQTRNCSKALTEEPRAGSVALRKHCAWTPRRHPTWAARQVVNLIQPDPCLSLKYEQSCQEKIQIFLFQQEIVCPVP